MKLLTSLLLLLTSSLTAINAAVLISEVADKGSAGVCNGNDWIELYNSDSDPVDLTGWILHDDNGPSDADAFTFTGNDNVLNAGDYLLLCNKLTNDLMSPQFGIGGDDTLTLLDANLAVASTVGPLLGADNNGFDISYAFDANTNGTYVYTTTPTPGTLNVINPIIIESPEEIKERLRLQHQLGARFFNMDSQGYPLADGMAPVLEFHLSMTKQNHDYLFQNRSYEVYVPFQSLQVREKDGTVVTSLDSPGRIRSKGQWSLFLSNCLDAPSFPFQLDMDHTNSSQTLFGVQRLYLRTHVGDNSNAREWTVHRMLARFGLPYLRSRHVNVFVNGVKAGFYTLLEAPDQEYVFSQNFPSYDPSNYALFKVKSLSIPALGCPSYTEGELEVARERQAADPDKGPSIYDRGEHKDSYPVLGPQGFEQCRMAFLGFVGQMREEAMLAYVGDGEPDCGSFYVKEGFVERDLGQKRWEPIMADFVNDNMICGLAKECTDTALLSSQADTENFLKSFAFYAATLFSDSPIGNGNNHYLADAGDGLGWKIVPYDFNSQGDLCDLFTQQCASRLPYWSILRPTCNSLGSNPLVGPLLTDPGFHQQYLGFVESFVDTIMGNSSFIGQIRNQLIAIAEDAEDDVWLMPGAFEMELSDDAADWEHIGMPWVPFLKARAEQIQLQLEALKEGTFPRGPHLEVPNEPSETCPDWRSTESTEAPPTCFMNCFYEGCYQSDWLIPMWCNLADGTCYHGDVDPQCEGTLDGDRYEGMVDRGEEMGTVCFAVGGVAASTSQCPPPPGFVQELEGIEGIMDAEVFGPNQTGIEDSEDSLDGSLDSPSSSMVGSSANSRMASSGPLHVMIAGVLSYFVAQRS